MQARHWILLTVLVVGACTDDTIVVEPAEFGELCGEVGPVQILALDPDRPLAYAGDRGMFGERRLVHVAYRDDDSDPLPFPSSDGYELWSMGACGEDPLLIAEGDFQLTSYPEIWPDLLLTCDRSTGQVSTLDPTGVRPANVVFETDACLNWQTDDGLLTIVPHDEDTGALVLQPWPDDPWTMKSEPIVVLDPIRIRATPPDLGPGIREVLRVTDEDYLALTTNDELVAISQLDGETTTVATDVREFETDLSGRYILWQSVEVTNDDPDWREGPIFLTDRQTGEETPLFESALAYTIPSAFTLLPLGILRVRDNSQQDHFYRLPTLESFPMPNDITILRVIDDTRVLIGGPWHRGPFSLFDMVTLELTELYDGTGWIGPSTRDDGFAVLDGVECCIDENSTRKAGRLIHVPYEGEPELLARRATLFYQFTSDDRLITSVDIDTNLVGSLIVVDPDSLDERLIDERVLRSSPTAHTEIDGDPIVAYAVVDPERQGVWLARLAK